MQCTCYGEERKTAQRTLAHAQLQDAQACQQSLSATKEEERGKQARLQKWETATDDE